MLVLSRKVGEKIVLPDCEVTITVLKSAGNNIRLGIEAPNSIRVYREEILQRIAARFPELVPLPA